MKPVSSPAKVFPRAAVATLLLAVFACPGCGLFLQEPVWHESVPSAELDRQWAKAALAADFAHLLEVAEAVHPDLYAATPRADVQAAVARELAALPAACMRLQFQPAVARVVALLGDAHSQVPVPSEEWNRFLDDGGRVLPYDVEVRDGRLFVTAVHEAAGPVAVGDELLAIGGRTSRELVASYRAMRSGSDAFVFAGLARGLRSHLWQLGVMTPFAVEFAGGDGVPRTVQREGLTRPEIGRALAQIAPPAPYRFERLAGDVGYLDFRSMRDADAFAALLASSLQAMQEWPARGLVVDLRHNGGGDSSLGDLLLAHLTDRPYRMAARKEWRASAPYRAYLKQRVRAWVRWLPLHYFSSFGREFFGVPEGSLVVSEVAAAVHERREPRYDGPVAFLIGPGTFSSAMMLADAVRHGRLGRLFGAPTGGSPNGFGELYPFDLPNTRLLVTVSSARFVGASGDAAARGGVVPDEVVAETGGAGDAVLAAALAWFAAAR